MDWAQSQQFYLSAGKPWVIDFTSLSLSFLIHETGMMKAVLTHRIVTKQQQDAFPVSRAGVITIEKLAMFSLGDFSAYQGHLTGSSASLSLLHLIFPLVSVSVSSRRTA